MHDFYYNNISLSSFGGRLLQPPTHTIAQRNKSFAKIYGQSGDEVIDNESYDNVKFKLKICFMPYIAQQSAQSLAYAVINWLAPLQDKYYVYRDTVNPDYFTYAALTNFDQIVRELPTLLTTTLEFNRVPFWYSDDGTTEIQLVSGATDNTITNPTLFDSEPLYKFYYLRQATNESAEITVNGLTTIAPLPLANKDYYFDNALKQMYVITNGLKNYVGTALLPNLIPGVNTVRYKLNNLISGSFYMTVTPNWRRL